MPANLRFLGAARNVTGSRYVLEAHEARILIDCGLYQERDLKARNWDPFPVAPESVDAVLLTHAHLDHCGYLPRLVRDGFRGRIHCTSATAEIGRIVMTDSAHLQEEDALFKQKRHAKEGRRGPYPEVALYTEADVERTVPLFSPVAYGAEVEVAPGIRAVFHDAGHILGSSMVAVTAGANGTSRTVLFSGDVGRGARPLLKDPTNCLQADYVQIESTYGDRVHGDVLDVKSQLADAIRDTLERGGNVVIPSFAVERTQELIFYLSELVRAGAIPRVAAFVDSPMATSVTEIYQRHPELQDADVRHQIHAHRSPFEFPGLRMLRTSDESKALNERRGSSIIIAGSGMCTGGRIKHHLVNNIGRPESTIVFVGYQAIGTLGRQIIDGASAVRIFGQNCPVKARVVTIRGFSGHADREELLAWLLALQSPPRHVFVTHGEEAAAVGFAELVTERTGWHASAPAYGEMAELA